MLRQIDSNHQKGNMKKKEKIYTAVLVIVAGTFLNLLFTRSLHLLLSGSANKIQLYSPMECIKGLFQVKQQFMLFLTFEGFLILCLFALLLQSNYACYSDLLKVTNNIEIPVPVGQFQHGSARWLDDNEYDKVFGSFLLDPWDPMLKDLIRRGRADGSALIEEAGEGGMQENRTNSPSTVSIEDQDQTQEEREGKEEIFDGYEKVVFKVKGESSMPAEENSRQTEENPQQAGDWKKEITLKEQEREPKTSTAKEAPFCLLKEGGLVVGMKKCGRKEKIYYIPEDTHTLTLGATRSGKTRTLVLQSICLMALAGESMVISDPKAELYEYCVDYLKALQYEVICLDFKNPEKSSRYNLLQPIIDAVKEKDMDRAEMYAWDITNILVGDNTSNEKIWENGEKSTIAAAILCVVVDNERRPEYQNLTNVYWFLAEMCKTVGNKMPMQEYVKKLSPGHPARALLSISDVAPSRTRGSFYTSALTTLRLFTSRSMYFITRASDHDISDLGRKKQVLFMILPDEKTTYYPIASLIVSQVYELLVKQSDERGGRLINRVNFVLEEFGNFTKLNDLTNKLTVGGGRGMRFHFFLQSLEQLTEKYSKETANIVKSNCQTWVYLQADDKETLTEICDKLGKYTCSGYQISSQHGKFTNPTSSSSVSLVSRDLLTTDEIRRVSRPYQIVMSRSYPAMMLSPDLSKWCFNDMLGLGNKEHNRRVREARELQRPVNMAHEEVMLWGIWKYYAKDLEMKENKQSSRPNIPMAMFSEMFLKGGSNKNEEE